jgi:hypothetical protein
MLQLLALLFCALVALICILAITVAPDWYRGPVARRCARVFASAVLACTSLCAGMVWFGWNANALGDRSELTISKSEKERSWRIQAVKLGVDPDTYVQMIYNLERNSR